MRPNPTGRKPNKVRTFIDQHGHVIRARTTKELREKIPGRMSKMYVDITAGGCKHIGYVVGQCWLTEYAVVEREA